ncbi:amidohydrolase family protein [bacterium]|nr:amidohydrolase family protein [bacterium]
MIFRAKYALVAPGEVRTDVRLELDGNRITSFNTGFVPGSPAADYNFGTAVILPGLVNAHCHLELEFCGGQVPYNGNFMDWLQAIRDLKRARGNTATAFPRDSIKQLLAAGCTTVVDHHATQLDWGAMSGCGLRHVPFKEYFEFNNHEPDADHLSSQAAQGFAPHAPYTASLEIARTCRELANRRHQPLSVHLSEIPGEIEFIRTGDSAQIIQLLKAADAYDAGFHGTGKTPIRLYADEGILNGPTYAVHVNYLADGDLQVLADFRPTVVYCPHSHAFFRHPPHPLPQYLEAGVPVALGTDSLASNDRLSPLHEAALVRRRFPQIAAAKLMELITSAGAEPLGWQGRLGRLEPGLLADFAIFKLDGDPGRGFTELFDAVLDDGQAALTMVDGIIRHTTVNPPNKPV